MIGVKFIIRVVLFLVSAGVISALLIFVWYGLSLLLRWTWDAIERSNSDFAVWLKTKFRKSESLPWLCSLGVHKWGRWEDTPAHIVNFRLGQMRRCIRCNIIEGR